MRLPEVRQCLRPWNCNIITKFRTLFKFKDTVKSFTWWWSLNTKLSMTRSCLVNHLTRALRMGNWSLMLGAMVADTGCLVSWPIDNSIVISDQSPALYWAPCWSHWLGSPGADEPLSRVSNYNSRCLHQISLQLLRSLPDPALLVLAHYLSIKFNST